MRRGFSGPRKTPPDPGPLATHDHEWRPIEDSPIIEDGAAIFREECNWAEVTSAVTSEKHDETFYGYGAECDETRHYRMEVAWAEKKRDDAPNIIYLASEFDHFPLVKERALIDAHSNGKLTDVDPDKAYGGVKAETDNWRVKFKANHSPQIDPKPR
jgi:hypothetical protein